MKSRLLVVVTVFIICLGTARAASAVSYTFTTIASTNDVFTSLLPEPSINNAGTVAFWGNNWYWGEGVFTGSENTITTVADTLGVYSGFAGAPDINDSGAVAFRARSDTGGWRIITEDLINTTTIADNSSTFTAFGGLSINNDGLVAFQADLQSGEGIFTGDGNSTTTIADTSSTSFTSAWRPSINNTGMVAFNWTSGPGVRGIDTGGGGPLTSIIGPVEFIDNASINDLGTVAFRSNGIFTGNGGPLTTIADNAGAFKAFGAPSLNNEGDLAFIANLDVGGAGIFTGPDVLTDSVILTGEVLDGSAITSLAMNINAFNDAGQVAFWAQLSDGTEGIYLASPVPIPAAVWLFASGLVGLVGIARKKAA